MSRNFCLSALSLTAIGACGWNWGDPQIYNLEHVVKVEVESHKHDRFVELFKEVGVEQGLGEPKYRSRRPHGSTIVEFEDATQAVIAGNGRPLTVFTVSFHCKMVACGDSLLAQRDVFVEKLQTEFEVTFEEDGLL